MHRAKVEKKLTVEMITDAGAFTALEESWNGLLESSPVDNYFLRWEWLREWWKAYGSKEMALCILLVRRGTELIGIAPLYKLKRESELVSKRSIMFLGTTEGSLVSEYLDFIYAPGESSTVVRAALEYITGEHLCDDILLQKIVSNSPSIHELKKGARTKGLLFRTMNDSVAPYLSLNGDFTHFMNSCGRSLRQNIRGGRRRLAELGDVEIRRTSSPEELKADMAELVRLHQMRWTSKNQPGAFADARFINFHESMARKALEDNRVELLLLSVDGRNIAALYNIRYREKVCFYQSGIDTSFSRTLSPGLILHSFSIEDAIEKGFKEYDFMLQGKTDAYKERWTDLQRHMCDIYMTHRGIAKFLSFAKETLKGYFITERP